MNIGIQTIKRSYTIAIVYSCFSEFIVLRRMTTMPPPSTVSTVRATRLGVRASKSYNRKWESAHSREHTQTPGAVGSEGSQMLFYVWFEFTSWLRGVGQGKGAWDCFLTIWAWDNCAFCNGKIKELDYWEIQPLLGLLDHGKVPVIN